MASLKNYIACLVETKNAMDGEIFINIDNNIVDNVYPYYRISNYGRVYNKYTEKFLSPGINGGGYYFVYLSTSSGQKPMQIHRLVMLAFNYIPNHKDYQVNHINGNKLDNYLYNLEWVTPSQNIIHAYETGLIHRGEDSSQSKITNEDAKNICDLLLTEKYTNIEIANMLNVSVRIVDDIKKGHSWRHISKDYVFNHRKGKAFSEEVVNNLCKYFEENDIGSLTINDHCRNALKYFNYECSEKTVDSARKIYTRKNYTNISNDYNF